MDCEDMKQIQLSAKKRLATRWAVAALTGALGICLMASPAISATPHLVDRIVAVVNDDIIVYQDLNERLTPLYEELLRSGQPPEKIKEILYDRRQALLNHLIDQKLMLQEAKRYGLTVSEKEVDETIERMKKANKLTDEMLRQALSQQGMTMAEFRNNYREQILIGQILHLEVISRIVITDADIKAYYDQHAAQYQGGTEYDLRHLMIEAPSYAPDEERQAAYKKMEAALAALDGGQSFTQVVQRYADQKYAEEGGELGRFNLDDLAPQLKQAVAKLTPGQHTPILESTQGYQILYLDKIIKTPPVPIAKVKDSIRQKLMKKLSDKRQEEWIKGLRKHAHIKIIQ
jgi:peptidyl-prolyl cis-trans isomerase SurA